MSIEIFKEGKPTTYRCRIASARQGKVLLYPEWELDGQGRFVALPDGMREEVTMRGYDYAALPPRTLVVDVEVRGVCETVRQMDYVMYRETEELVFNGAALAVDPVPYVCSVSDVVTRPDGGVDYMYRKTENPQDLSFPRCGGDGGVIPHSLLILRGGTEFYGPYHYTSHGDYRVLSPFPCNVRHEPHIIKAASEDLWRQGFHAMLTGMRQGPGITIQLAGSKIMVLDGMNTNVLYGLCAAGDCKGLKEFLEDFPGISLDDFEPRGETPLRVACEEKSHGAVEFLLDHGVKVACAMHGETSLVDMVQKGGDEKLREIFRKRGYIAPPHSDGAEKDAFQPAQHPQGPEVVYKVQPGDNKQKPVSPKGKIKIGRDYERDGQLEYECFDSLAGVPHMPRASRNINVVSSGKVQPGGRCWCEPAIAKVAAFMELFPGCYWFVDTQVNGRRRVWKCKAIDLVAHCPERTDFPRYCLYLNPETGVAYHTSTGRDSINIQFELDVDE